MERSVLVAKYLQMQGRFTDDLAIGFDLRARFRGFNKDIVGDCAVRAALGIGRHWHSPAPDHAYGCNEHRAKFALFSHNTLCLKETTRATDV